MPRKHYDGAEEVSRAGPLSQDAEILYTLLLEEVNRLRQEAGLSERTREDIAQARRQIVYRLQRARAAEEKT